MATQSRKSSTGGEPLTAMPSIEQLQHDTMASARAIEHQLGIYSDGTPVPLTSWQRLWYTNREHWLHAQVKQSRMKANEVVDELERLHVPDRTLKDIALIQSFVSEHVSLAYRSALKNKFEENEFLTPEAINPLLWILGWMVNIGAVGFCLYWVLAWGITNTGATLDAWRTSYIVSVSQDIFLYEVTKMGFKYVFTLVSVRPQLSAIRQVINAAALSYIQYGPPKHQSKSEITIVQHFSPSCRAASMSKVKSLAAAAILRQINDADYERCQQHRTFALSTLVYFFMFVMALVALIHAELEDAAMDPLVQSMWSAIFLALSLIDIRSPTTVIVLVVVGSSMFLYYTLAYPDVMKTARNVRRADRNFHYIRRCSHQHYEWQLKHRQAHFLPWRQRWVHELRRGYASLKARGLKYWSLLQFMCSSEYLTYSQLQRSHDDSSWMELNRFAVLMSVNTTGGTSTIDELLSLQGTKKNRASSRDESVEVASTRLTELFARKQNSFFNTSMVRRVVQKKMLGRIPDEIMAMRPTGGAPIDLGLEMRRVAHKAWLMGKVLQGVEGGLMELHGSAFIGKGGDNDQGSPTDQLVAPTLYANKPRAYAAQHLQCDITTDKEKALRLILVRLRRIEGKVTPGSSKDAAFCSDKDIKNYFVTFEELVEMVEWVWNVYSPGNLPLSLEERKEARESFDMWQQTGRYWEEADISAQMGEFGGLGNDVSWSSEPQSMIPSPTAAGGGGILDGRMRLAPLRVQANQPQVQPRKQSLLATYDHFKPLPLSADILPVLTSTEPLHPLVPPAVLDKLKYYNVAISPSMTARNPSSNEEMLVLSTSQKHIGLPGKDPNRPKYVTLAVSFLEFRYWFLHLTTHIERLREVVPKSRESVGIKKMEEVQRKHLESRLAGIDAATGTNSRMSAPTFPGSVSPASVLPLVHIQVSQTVVDSSNLPTVVGSVWDSFFLVGFFTRWYRKRQAEQEDWTTRKPVIVVCDSAYFRSVFTAAALSLLPFGSTITINSVKVTKIVSIEYVVASSASASRLSSSLLSGAAAMTAVLQKSYPTATVAAPTVVPVADPAMASMIVQSPAGRSTGSTFLGFFTRWNQSRQKARVFISPDITEGDVIYPTTEKVNIKNHGVMHGEDEEKGSLYGLITSQKIASLKETVEPEIQLSAMEPDSLLPSLSLALNPSVNDANGNISAVSSSASLQQLISSPNALRALGFSMFSERSQVRFEGTYSEHSSIDESSEVDIESPKMHAATTRSSIDVTRLGEWAVTRKDSNDSIDIDTIERLILKPLESDGADSLYYSENLPIGESGEVGIMGSVVPANVNNSSERTIDSIEKLIARHLDSDGVELKSKPDFNRQSSDLRTSCRLTYSEKELLDDLFRPIENDDTSLQQDQDAAERTRQEAEAAAVAKQQAATDERLREQRLREEEERRLDLLTKQAHREAMQMAEQRFVAAEAEKKRLQQEAADNERKAKTAIEEAARQERERLHEAEAVAAAAAAAVTAAAAATETETAEALVASPATAAKMADEQQLPAPVASGAVADADAEADQVAKLRKQIEDKKALLLAKAKANVRETGQGEDTATAKAADNAADAKVKPNIAASEYTGNA